MKRLLRRIGRVLLGPVEELYVDPLVVSRRDMEGVEAMARLEDRQREAFKQLVQEGKSLLVGYAPPDPYNGDRIDAQAFKAGHVSPSERRRLKKVASVKPSLLNTTRSRSANS